MEECMAKPREPLERRFWRHVDRGAGCWLWRGPRNQAGYGQLHHRSGGATSVHRFSYELHHGPIPKGLFVLHHCDNPSCVNPDHLYAGTARDNTLDAMGRGRWVAPASAARTRRSKLTDDQVRAIRADTRKHVLIAIDHRIGVTTVYNIKARLRKQWVPDLP